MLSLVLTCVYLCSTALQTAHRVQLLLCHASPCMLLSYVTTTSARRTHHLCLPFCLQESEPSSSLDLSELISGRKKLPGRDSTRGMSDKKGSTSRPAAPGSLAQPLLATAGEPGNSGGAAGAGALQASGCSSHGVCGPYCWEANKGVNFSTTSVSTCRQAR